MRISNDAAASSLSFSFRRTLIDSGEPLEAVDAARDLARTQAIRAEEVFELFLKERTRQALGVDGWATLLTSGKGFLLIGDVVDWLFEHGYAAVGTDASASVGGSASEAIANILRLAEEIRSGKRLRVAGPRDATAELRTAALASLSGAGVAGSPTALRSAIGLSSTTDWLA